MIRRFAGYVFEDIELDEYDHLITEAVITNSRIAIDWEEDGVGYHLMALSTDGVLYKGTFGTPRPRPDCTIALTRYIAKDGDEILVGKWIDASEGRSGTCIFELEQSDGD